MLYYMAGATFLASKNFKEEEDIYREVRKDPTENSFFTFPLHFFFWTFSGLSLQFLLLLLAQILFFNFREWVITGKTSVIFLLFK